MEARIRLSRHPRYLRESLVVSYRVNKITSVIGAHEGPRGLEQYVKIVFRCIRVPVCTYILTYACACVCVYVVCVQM